MPVMGLPQTTQYVIMQGVSVLIGQDYIHFGDISTSNANRAGNAVFDTVRLGFLCVDKIQY